MFLSAVGSQRLMVIKVSPICVAVPAFIISKGALTSSPIKSGTFSYQ